MSNAIIRAELETRLKTWADAQTPKIPIAFQNVSFSKPTDGSPFMEAFLIPNITRNNELSGQRKTLSGIFQVNVWAKGGNGMKTVERLTDQVISLFPIVPKTGVVSIESTPSAESPIHDSSGWVIVPVTIKYRYES